MFMKHLINKTVLLIFAIVLLLTLPIQIFAAEPDNSFSTIYSSKYYSDLNNYEWVVQAADNLYEYRILEGKTNPTSISYGLFSPDSKITRIYLYSILDEILIKAGIDDKNFVLNFTNPLIKTVLDNSRYVNDKFYTEDYITREECFYTIYNFLVNNFNYHRDEPDVSDGLFKFVDDKNISQKYKIAIYNLLQSGYISKANKLYPQNNINKAELAILLNQIVLRYSNKFEKVNSIIPFSEKLQEYPEATTVWITLKSFGWNDYVCAGIIGNMMAEVGGHTLDLNIINCAYDHAPNGYLTGSFGLCAWTPSSNYYGSKWFEDTSIEAQCRFIKNSLEEQISWGLSVDDFLSVDNVYDAAYYFMKYYERPGHLNTSNRYADALIAYEYFTND